MEIMVKSMQINGNNATISKYEVMKAFFKTEQEDNIDMAEELNKLINVFYEQERKTKRNVTVLSFDVETHKHAIDYIRQASIG